jgi:hypothetical protein
MISMPMVVNDFFARTKPTVNVRNVTDTKAENDYRCCNDRFSSCYVPC